MTVYSTKIGIIDMSPWLDRMRSNLKKGYGILEQTPIGKTSKGGYFWFDEDKNPALTTRSVNALIKKITNE